LEVRHLERVALGTPYPGVVARVKTIVSHPELRGRCTLAADATGVGGPVVDMLRGAGLGCELSAVMITSSDKERQSGQTCYVPKRDLIAGVQVMLERGQLKIARQMRETGALVQSVCVPRVLLSWARDEQDESDERG
jgi:hypothetical protein